MEPRNKEISTEEFGVDNHQINTDDEAAAENETAAFSGSETEEVKKEKWFVRLYKSELFTRGFKILLCVFLGALFIYILSRFVAPFAEFWTRYPAQGIRFLLAKITGWFPFSLAECIILSLPIIALAYIIGSTVSTKKDESNANFYRWVRPMISLVLVVLTIFFTAFAPAYGRFTLASNLGLERKDVTVKELLSTGSILSAMVKEDLEEIKFDTDGASVMPYSYSELKEKVNDAFEKYAAEADYISHFNSNPKPIALSNLMTYTHISGVYTFMTGESNINTNYPDFLIPYTMAHEMAHQRGIAREDEANFVAFLVCIGSDDAYIRYSGYANMLNYIFSAITGEDLQASITFVSYTLPNEIRGELLAYSTFFDKYRESTASEVTGAINNTHLQLQGQKEGTKSYGLVVDLAVAYYKE